MLSQKKCDVAKMHLQHMSVRKKKGRKAKCTRCGLSIHDLDKALLMTAMTNGDCIGGVRASMSKSALVLRSHQACGRQQMCCRKVVAGQCDRGHRACLVCFSTPFHEFAVHGVQFSNSRALRSKCQWQSSKNAVPSHGFCSKNESRTCKSRSRTLCAFSVISVYRVARSSGRLLVDGADVFQNYD